MANTLLTLPATMFQIETKPILIRKYHQRKFPKRVLVLVIEHDAETQDSIAIQVKAAGHNCFCVSSEIEALAWIRSSCPDVVLVDLLLPDSDHRQLSQGIQKAAPSAKIVVLARADATESIREALNWGADDYLEKPISGLRLASVLKHISQFHRHHYTPGYLPDAFFNGDQLCYKTALSKFKKATKLNIPVVFEGAPGTGKTTAARHFLGEVLNEMPVVCFDATKEEECAFSQKLISLAAHRKTHRFGILIRHLEAASLELQRTILKQLDTPGQIVVATSNGRLMDYLEDGILDAELFSRMSAAPFWLAPINERKNDRELISRQFLQQANAELATDMPFSALTAMSSSFPDNICGLKRAIFAAVSSLERSDGGVQLVDSNSLTASSADDPTATRTTVNLLDQNGDLRSLDAIEADSIRFAFAHLDGRMGKIAKALKLGRTTLYRKLTKLKLTQNQHADLCEQNETRVHTQSEKITARAA